MSGERRIRVELPARPAHAYEVVVGHGCLGRECRRLGQAGGRWLAIVDAAIAGLHGREAMEGLAEGGAEIESVAVAGGESTKTRETAARLQDRALAAGLGRDGRILAVGGGVVGDLAGFVAATLYRGIPHVQAPTTLLAMVDSSVGGKTGVDTPAGKNLVGAFHQPQAVVADVATLATLPDAELAAGMAEVVKYGVIVDEQLFIDLEDGLLESCAARVPEALIATVELCVRLKAEVVAADETETGRRRILNFGHTVGHAIEAATDYAVRHGEAVAMGMVAEARLAAEYLDTPADLAERITAMCRRAGLEPALPDGLSVDAVVHRARADKKNVGGEIRCALPEAVGRMARGDGGWSVGVEEQALRRAIETLR